MDFSRTEIELKVNSILDKLRHHLQKDDGDIEFVRWEPEYSTIVLKFIGVCRDCPLQLMTLRGGIERFILREMNFVKRVEAE
jgi:Fe-S cluster biogenesis protein NfuA